jgi:hypothetical protein
MPWQPATITRAFQNDFTKTLHRLKSSDTQTIYWCLKRMESKNQEELGGNQVRPKQYEGNIE